MALGHLYPHITLVQLSPGICKCASVFMVTYVQVGNSCAYPWITFDTRA